MNLTNGKKIMIGGGTALFILIIAVIIFIIIKHNNKSKTPDTCEWSYTGWSMCTDQEQTRVVSCKNKEGGDCDDSNCTSTKPESNQNCDTCEWSYTGWTVCENDTQSRTVSCKNKEGDCDISKCTSTKPDSTRSCTDIDTCEWSYTDWTPKCSSENMPQTRTSTCKNKKNQSCDDSKCGSKQPLNRVCSNGFGFLDNVYIFTYADATNNTIMQK